MSTSIEIFLSLLKELSVQAIKHLKQKVLQQGGDLVLIDSEQYQSDLIFTILRSILIPFFSLTKWISKTSSEGIQRELSNLCDQLINKYNAGNLIDDVKAMCVEMLSHETFIITKSFLSGSLLKVLKIQKFNSHSTNLKKKIRSNTFFYSMNQMKSGVAALPAQDVFKKIIDFQNDISGTPDNNINNRSLFYLKFASQLVFNSRPRGAYDEKIIPLMLPEGATYENRRGLLAESIRDDGSKIELEKQHDFLKKVITDSQCPTSDNNARMVVLMEPLKIRMLTVAETNYQLGTRGLQSDLLKCWKRTAWSTMKDGALDKFINSYNAENFPFDNVMMSVDYTDATNKIKSCATKIVVNEHLDYHMCSPEFKRYIFASISARKIDTTDTLVLLDEHTEDIYKYFRKDNINIFKQRKGQMMGNTLSFPILCTINAATSLQLHYEHDDFFENQYQLWKRTNSQSKDYNMLLEDQFWEWRDAKHRNHEAFNWKCVIKEYKERQKIEPLTVSINGDDLLDLNIKVPQVVRENHQEHFDYEYAGEDQSERHTAIAANYGLIKNHVKTITRPDICNMNSRQFILINKELREVGYMNQRLLFDHNVKKSSRIDFSEDESPYAARHNKFIDLCNSMTIEERESRSLEFKALNIESFKREKCKHPCLSTNVGGLGLYDIFNEEPAKIARDRVLKFIIPTMQRQIATTNIYVKNRKKLPKGTRYSWSSDLVVKPALYGKFDLSQFVKNILWSDYECRSEILMNIATIALLNLIVELEVSLTPYRANEKSITMREAKGNLLKYFSEMFVASHPNQNTDFVNYYSAIICKCERKMNKSYWNHIFRPDFETQSRLNNDYFFMSDESGWFISPMNIKNSPFTILFELVFGDAQDN